MRGRSNTVQFRNALSSESHGVVHSPNIKTHIMKIYTEISDLSTFKPWDGAVDAYNRLIDAGKGEAFIQALDDVYPDGVTETQLNDILWFEREWCYQLVDLNKHGYERFYASDIYESAVVSDYITKWIEEKNQDTPNRTWYVTESDLENSIIEWLEENQDSDDRDKLAERWLNDVGKKDIEYVAEYN